MRLALRFCSRRSLWQQRIIPVNASIKDVSLPCQQLSHVWSTRQSQTCFSQVITNSVRYYSEGSISSKELNDKEHVFNPPAQTQSSNPALVQGQQKHPFMELLAQCGSPSDVLDLTTVYSPTARQVSNCLSHMWSIMKKMSQEQHHYELQLMFEHPAFEKFMQKAMASVHYMRSEDLVYALLGMIKLEVPQKSRVIQTFLRVCQEKLNHFDEKSLSILASCLQQMEDSPSVRALKEGMRLLVEVRLPEIKNVIPLQSMMRLVGKDAPLTLKRKLEVKALSMTDQFSLPNAQHMIYTMATMGFHSKPLLAICSKKVTENLHGIPFNRLYKVMQSSKELLYRDLEMLTGISDYVASTIDIWTNKQVLLFLSVFESLVFCPTALMEVYAEKVIANPDALTLRDLLLVLKVYSSLNYDLRHHRQPFLDSLSQALDSYLPKMSGYGLLQAVYCLCLQGHFPSAPLEHLLQSSTLEQLRTTAPRFLPYQERKFQVVDLCLRLDRPPLPQPLTVPRSVLGDPAPINPLFNNLILEDLQRIVGEEGWTLQEKVVVENIYLRNLCFVLFFYYCRIVLICMPHSGVCYGTSNPRGHMAVKIRHLRILGYEPVLVRLQLLYTLPRSHSNI
uniref:FAST kinase leucine-rich domain-containing protein n=1 Tax=Sphaeramia orbicularis TaxID=375764 RepID=A0A672YV17_9TELE